jgi:hypothetical protein
MRSCSLPSKAIFLNISCADTARVQVNARFRSHLPRGKSVRKKLCLFIAPSPASYNQEDNRQIWRPHMKLAAHAITALRDCLSYIQRVTVAQRIDECQPKLYVERVTQEDFTQEVIKALADVPLMHFFSIYAHITVPESGKFRFYPFGASKEVTESSGNSILRRKFSAIY